jgi:hypothetical protein
MLKRFWNSVPAGAPAPTPASTPTPDSGGAARRPVTVLDRTIMTIGCRDCDPIPKVPEAGRIVAGEAGPVQIMHNGLRVKAGGYYGDWMAQVIRGLRGHHEPQEELLFHALLPYARHDTLMVELGAFWSYYSLWYLHEVPGSRTLGVEPDPEHLDVGRFNGGLNGFSHRMRFHQAWVGGEGEREMTAAVESDGQPRTLPCVDMGAVLALAGGDIEMLHVDAQGAELPFIRSMAAADGPRRVRFVVVSTHHESISGSPSTHADCVEALTGLGAHVLCEHAVGESFSGDGLIVASFLAEDRRIRLPAISRNQPRFSLFPPDGE